MGTELFKHYTAEKTPFLKLGFNIEWNVYRATHKQRNIPVSIFVCEKKNIKKLGGNYKNIIEQLKKITTELSKFKHPNILSVIEPMIEDKNCIGFVTDRIAYTLKSWVETTKPSKLEIKAVIIEVCKAITFLHDDAHCSHNNLNPENIFIDENNKIKIGSLEYSVSDPPISGGDIKLNTSLQDLKYVAPENVFNDKCYYSSDVFSMGTIIYHILKIFNNDTTNPDLINITSLSNNNIESYKSLSFNIDGLLDKAKIDYDDKELLRKCLIREPSNRPSFQDLLENSWFNDPKLKALSFVDRLNENDQQKNEEFLKQFPKIVDMFENKILEKRFLPAFLNGLSNEFLIVPCLSPIFAILNKSDLHINFEKIVWPHLKSLFTLKSMPAQCLYFLLQKVEFIGDKVSKSEFSNNFLKIICKALDCNVLKIQTVVADHIIYITKKIDSLTFKNQVYPRIITTLQTTNSQQLKIKLLNSMKELYKLLDQNTINENLLNNLDKIRKSDNGAEICMLISSIYEEIAKVVTIISIANKILPNLISILVSGNISKGNFDSLMSIVHKYLDRIKKDREKDLYDDNAPQKKKDDIISEIEESKNKKNDNKADDDFLNSFFSNNITSTNNNTNINKNNNNNNTGGLEFLDNISLSSNPTPNLSQNNNLNTNNNTQSNNNMNVNFDFSTNSNSNINRNNSLQSNINLSNTNIHKNYSFQESNFGQSNSLNKNTITPNVSNNNNLNFDFNLSGNNTNKQNTSSTSNYNFNLNNNQQQNKNVNLDNLLNNLDKPSVQPTTSNNNLNMNINLGMNNFNTGNQNSFMQTQTQNQSNSGFDQMNLNFLSGNNNTSNNNNMNFNLSSNNNNNMNFNMNNNMNMMNMNNMNLNMGNMNIMNMNNMGNMNMMNQNNNNSNNNFNFNFQSGNSNSNNNNNNSNNPFTFL